MTNANDRARVPAGRREGGRFAPEDHGTETATELGDATEYVTMGDVGSYPSDVNRFVTNDQLAKRKSELFEEWREAADRAVDRWPASMPTDVGAMSVMEGALNEARMRKDPEWDGWDEDTAPHVTKEELREAIRDMASEEDTFETNDLMERMLREPKDRDDLLSSVYTTGRQEGNICGDRWEDRTALFDSARDVAVNGTPADIESDPLASAIADAARESVGGEAADEDYFGCVGAMEYGDDPNLSRMVDDEIESLRQDEIGNLKSAKIGTPVVAFGRAGLWNGSADNGAFIDADSVGTLIGNGDPYSGMDGSSWSVDARNELVWHGTHHDGSNTVVFRRLRPGVTREQAEAMTPDELVSQGTVPLGGAVVGVYGMP